MVGKQDKRTMVMWSNEVNYDEDDGELRSNNGDSLSNEFKYFLFIMRLAIERCCSRPSHTEPSSIFKWMALICLIISPDPIQYPIHSLIFVMHTYFSWIKLLICRALIQKDCFFMKRWHDECKYKHLPVYFSYRDTMYLILLTVCKWHSNRIRSYLSLSAAGLAVCLCFSTGSRWVFMLLTISKQCPFGETITVWICVFGTFGWIDQSFCDRPLLNLWITTKCIHIENHLCKLWLRT